MAGEKSKSEIFEPNLVINFYQRLIDDEVKRAGKDIDARLSSVKRFLTDCDEVVSVLEGYFKENEQYSKEELQNARELVNKLRRYRNIFSADFDGLVANLQKRIDVFGVTARAIESKADMSLPFLIRVSKAAAEKASLSIMNYLYFGGLKTIEDITNELKLDSDAAGSSLSRLIEYQIIKEVKVEDKTYYSIVEQAKTPSMEYILELCVTTEQPFPEILKD